MKKTYFCKENLSDEAINKRINLVILIGLVFLVFYLPLDFGGHSSSFVGFRPVTVLWCLSFLMMGLFLLSFQKISDSLNALKWPLVLFFLLLALSSLFSVCPYDSFLESFKFLSYFFLFFLALNISKTSRYLNIITNSLIVSGLAVTLAGMFIFVLTNYCNIPSNFYATFYQTDVCAGFLVLVIPLALSLFLSDEVKPIDYFYSFSVVLMTLGLLLTKSRGGWISFLIVLIFIVWQKRHLPKKIIFYKSLILIVAILAVATVTGAVLNKYYSSKPEDISRLPNITKFVPEGVTSLALDSSNSVKARLCFWDAAFKMFLHHPVLGTGLETYDRFYSQYQKDLRFFSKFPHNFYLGLLSETGLFSFLAFLVVLYILLLKFKEALKVSKGTNLHPLVVGLIAGSCASLLHVFVDVDWLFSAIPVFFWIEIGLILAIIDYLKKKPENDDFASVYPSNKNRLVFRYVLSYLIIITGLILCLPYTAEKIAVRGAFFEASGEAAGGTATSGKATNGELKEALNSYRLAGKIDWLNPEYHKRIAILYFKQKPNEKIISLDEAFYQMKKAVDLDPLRASNKVWLAKFYLEKQNELEYLKNLAEAIKLDGVNNPSYYNSVALYYLSKGKPEQARVYYTDIINLYPDNLFGEMWYFRRDHIKQQLSESYVGLGTIYINETKTSEAIKCLEKAVKLNPQNPSANFILGIAYFSGGFWEKAVKSFESAVKLDKNNSSAYYYAGLSYEKLGNHKKAQMYLKKYEQREKNSKR